MRWTIAAGVALATALAPAACKQTIIVDQAAGDGGGVSIDGGPIPACSGPSIDPKVANSLEVIVAMDRSTGMTTAKFGDTTALIAARNTIDDIAAQYQKVVLFGYVEFPGNFMCSSGQGGCCATSVAPPSQTNAGFGIALHACDQPSTSCPMSSQRATATALGRCLPSFSQPGRARRSVLLITNDQPDCDFGTDTPCNEARNAASTLYTQYNVSTYVVAPGTFDPTSNTTACLQGIAAYGGGKGNFRPASDMQELNDAIDGVVHSIAQFACHLDLTPSQIRSTDSVVLVWKGAVVPFDRSGYDGWDLTPNQNGYMIDLSTGKWCDRLIQDGPGAFTLLTDCNPAHH